MTSYRSPWAILGIRETDDERAVKRAYSAKLKEMGGIVSGADSAAFASFIASETSKWSKLIKSANIKVE